MNDYTSNNGDHSLPMTFPFGQEWVMNWQEKHYKWCVIGVRGDTGAYEFLTSSSVFGCWNDLYEEYRKLKETLDYMVLKVHRSWIQQAKG